MSQERKSFTVSDRRHFTSEGEPRRDEDEALPEERTAPPPATPDDVPRAAAQPGGAPEGADFSSFIVSLAAQAGAALSGEGEGAAEGAGLDAARYLISILEMLAEKTQGRRTPREDEVIAAVLYELRMAYVAQSRAGSK
jgi:hypothetical protein